MPRLTLLGPAVVADDSGVEVTGRAAQRHCLALLALLARERRGLGRDRLIALLWPESDENTARHRLSVCLHVLRQRLGETSIIRAGDAVALGSGWSADVWEFEQAVERGEFERAYVAWHPLLASFYLRAAPGFEHWLEHWRARLARRYLAVVEALAEEAARAGDLASTIRYQRELIEQEPWAYGRIVALMRAFAADGQAEGALRCARAYAITVREEYGLEPHPEVASCAAEIARARGAWAQERPGVEQQLPGRSA